MTAPVNAVSISRRPSLHLPFSRGCCCPEVPTALRTVPPTYVRPQLTLPHHDVTPRSTSQPSSFFFLFLLYFPFTFLNPGLDKSRRLLRSFQPGHLARRPVSIATLQYRSDSDSHCRVEKEPKKTKQYREISHLFSERGKRELKHVTSLDPIAHIPHSIAPISTQTRRSDFFRHRLDRNESLRCVVTIEKKKEEVAR